MRKAQLWLCGVALVALFGLYLHVDLARAAEDSVNALIVKLGVAVEKKDAAAGKKLVEQIGKHPDASIDVIMVAFKLRNKDGIGVGAKADTIKPDGIEQMIISLDRNPPSDADVKEQLAAWAQMGYICAAISDVIADPEKADINKASDQKLWKKYNEEFKKASLAFADMAKGKPTPAAVQKAARNLNNTCLKCHDDFR
ncbi:MAG: hypothetical protein AB7K24_08795 [Gemmataceae bacterium]